MKRKRRRRKMVEFKKKKKEIYIRKKNKKWRWIVRHKDQREKRGEKRGYIREVPSFPPSPTPTRTRNVKWRASKPFLTLIPCFSLSFPYLFYSFLSSHVLLAPLFLPCHTVCPHIFLPLHFLLPRSRPRASHRRSQCGLAPSRLISLNYS